MHASRKQLPRSTARPAEHLEALIQASPLAIQEFDLDGRVRLWNAAAERIYGWRSEEVVGKATPTIPETERESHEGLLDRLRRGEVLTEVDTTRLRKDGEKIHVRISAAPIFDDTGSVCGITSLAADITAQKSLEEQLLQAQKMEAIGQLAGGIAHDFNNLLTAISASSDLLLARLEPANPMRADLDEIRAAADRATALTRQLLAFSRRQVLRPRVLDLNACIRELASLLERLIGDDVKLVTRLDPDLGHIKADPAQIQQVILNLALNARDAMPDGGRLTIESANVDSSSDAHVHGLPGSYVLLTVADEGHGMDADTLGRVFEPFFTTKGRNGGTGLGLATVYGIVKQSGGNVWAESEPGHGATFRVYLPRIDEPAEPWTPLSQETPSGGSETIMLVEDDASVRGIARRALANAGYRALEAASPSEAIALSYRYPGDIHLLVTDVVMPGMNGQKLAAILSGSRTAMKVLFVSGYPSTPLTPEGALEPGTNFLQKPFGVADLLRTVRSVLDEQ
jgi:PAS domain S-box-containing protein